MNSSLWILAIGFTAQGFFSARMLVQWILSERARRVLSPSMFWVFSLAGSWLLCIYGWLRADFAIVAGQFLSYYIYLWNLRMKGVLCRTPDIIRLVLLLTPIAAVSMMLTDAQAIAGMFFHNTSIPAWMLVYGSAGQVLFTLRFVWQWYYSRRNGVSLLPAGFWMMSLAGAALIVSYGIMRHDPVLVIGHSFGIVTYTRNLMIGHRTIKNRQR